MGPLSSLDVVDNINILPRTGTKNGFHCRPACKVVATVTELQRFAERNRINVRKIKAKSETAASTMSVYFPH